MTENIDKIDKFLVIHQNLPNHMLKNIIVIMTWVFTKINYDIQYLNHYYKLP